MSSLEAEYSTRERAALFQSLCSFLDPGHDGDYTMAGQATGVVPNALRQAVFRLRQRFRAHLRQSIAGTLDDPSESLIDEELTALRNALSA